MENEALQTILHYLSNEKGKGIHYFGSGVGARMFADFYLNGKIYLGDAPDMLIRKDNGALIIEHFEFDSYHVNNKGSKNRREQARIQRKQDMEIPTEAGIEFRDKINGSSSYNNYLQNVSKAFKRHYASIHRYKDRLKKRGLIDNDMQVNVLFLIEDVSPLGSMVAKRSEFESMAIPLVVACCKEFLDLIKNSPDVDYVLTCSSAGNNEYMWLIDNSEIDVYYKHIEDYKNMDFLNFTPKVYGYKIVIPKNDTETLM